MSPLPPSFTLRSARPNEGDALAAFNAAAHALPADDGWSEHIHDWTLDLMSGQHPGCRVDDFLVVEDPAGGIASTLVLLDQRWRVAGVTLPVGRIELVGTAPAHRRQGLVRALMEEVHRRSAARGHLLQVISGKPWFYRQFGYEYALAKTSSASLPVGAIATSPGDQLNVRPARESDLDFITDLAEVGAARDGVTCVRSREQWGYDLDTPRPGNGHAIEVGVLERHDSASIGFVAHHRRLHDGRLLIRAVELVDPSRWPSLSDPLLAVLAARGRERAGAQTLEQLALLLGGRHPIVALSGAAAELPSDEWYVRIADVAALLEALRPALDRRTAGSDLFRAWSGRLELDWHRGGLSVAWEDGRVTAIEPRVRVPSEEADVALPVGALWMLLLGHRSIDELEACYPDCVVGNPSTRVQLRCLFPRQSAAVWSVL